MSILDKIIMDDLDEIEVHDVLFQFDDEEPVKIAYVAGGKFSLTLATAETETPEIVFSNGKGKEFKIFLRKSKDEL